MLRFKAKLMAESASLSRIVCSNRKHIALFYNKENAHHDDAHTKATYEVLKAQLDRYEGVEYNDHGIVSTPVVNNIEALSKFTCNSNWADLCGHIGYDSQHHEVFNFGKHKGRSVEQVFKEEPAYYDWMMKADFPLSTKNCITDIHRRMQDAKLKALQEKYAPGQQTKLF